MKIIIIVPECLEDGKSVLYRGKRNVTASGIPCQYWSSTSPHAHTYQFNAENYCRNSDRTTVQAWCYTQDVNVRWEYCDIPVCRKRISIPFFFYNHP